jgi:hypothetical protein
MSTSGTIHYCFHVPTELVIRNGTRPPKRYHIISPLFLLLKKGFIAVWVVPGPHPSSLCPLLCSNLIMSYIQIHPAVKYAGCFAVIGSSCVRAGARPPNEIYEPMAKPQVSFLRSLPFKQGLRVLAFFVYSTQIFQIRRTHLLFYTCY